MAFDVGTTFSGVSYWYECYPGLGDRWLRGHSFSVLDPGQIPEVKGVTK